MRCRRSAYMSRQSFQQHSEAVIRFAIGWIYQPWVSFSEIRKPAPGISPECVCLEQILAVFLEDARKPILFEFILRADFYGRAAAIEKGDAELTRVVPRMVLDAVGRLLVLMEGEGPGLGNLVPTCADTAGRPESGKVRFVQPNQAQGAYGLERAPAAIVDITVIDPSQVRDPQQGFDESDIQRSASIKHPELSVGGIEPVAAIAPEMKGMKALSVDAMNRRAGFKRKNRKSPLMEPLRRQRRIGLIRRCRTLRRHALERSAGRFRDRRLSERPVGSAQRARRLA